MRKKKPLLVVKFGGECMANDSVEETVDLVLQLRKHYRLCVVVSARAEVTDRLADLAIAISPKPDLREYDALLATGEMESASLLALRLIHNNCAAKSVNAFQMRLRTDSTHGKARILGVDPLVLREIRQSDTIHVVAGFQGITDGNAISTFGRGGSDTTAVFLAAALRAKECVIYKKHLGIFDTDPNHDTRAKLLAKLDSGDLVDMALAGMKAVHTRAAEFAHINCVPLRIASVRDASGGTRVLASPSAAASDKIFKFVISRDKVLVEFCDVRNRPGVFALIYSALIRDSIYVSAVSQSHFLEDLAVVDVLCGKEDGPRVLRVADSLVKKKLLARCQQHSGITSFSLIGRQMIARAGVLHHFLGVFADLNVPIRMANTSASRITAVVDDSIVEDRYQKICDGMRAVSLLEN